MSTTAPALAPDLVEGLRRLKLATIRQLAPELLVTAKTQRWNPEEFLRTLIEAEVAARDAERAADDRACAAGADRLALASAILALLSAAAVLYTAYSRRRIAPIVLSAGHRTFASSCASFSLIFGAPQCGYRWRIATIAPRIASGVSFQ